MPEPMNPNTFRAMRALVKSILQFPQGREWTVQGFGMLRTYPDIGDAEKRYRLNVWDYRLQVPHVSVIHDHPWDFISYVISGEIRNVRYSEHAPPYHQSTGSWGDAGREGRSSAYNWMLLRTGVEGGADEHPAIYGTSLYCRPIERYRTGDVYTQAAHEIHQSCPLQGSVSLNERTRVGTGDTARVFWPAGEEWVDAKPRVATEAEVIEATQLALMRWTH
jgi:hypothetical protein